MTYVDVCDALEKGTVIFNAAGAHIPKLAGLCLAACDATNLPCALNMYITTPGKRTSAPPHTDKQDVCVIQTQGCKSWKVFAVPDPSSKPIADIFARGKGDDSLPLHTLSASSELLLETTLYPGDVLFIPAGFPHTTSTVERALTDNDNNKNSNNINNNDNDNLSDDTSIHLTLGIDHHIWELDYLSVIRLSYQRSGQVKSAIFETMNDESNPFVGNVNLLPVHILSKIVAELPLGLLDKDGESMVDDIVSKTAELIAIADPDCTIDSVTIKETVERIRQQGIELFDIHRDMYIAAIHEGCIRETENTMTAHLEDKKSMQMSPERLQRLSLFRVKRYYDQINDSKEQLKQWSMTGPIVVNKDELSICSLSVGDKVEAELGGAFFPATVTRITMENTYDVTFFDGDKEKGLIRQQIRFLPLPHSSQDVDISKMTAKQLKRWKKEQEKIQSNL
jgi:Cupin superfamily protein